MSISVIIPCFNVGKTIYRAVKSIAIQTLLPDEVILVDDCSTDNTFEVIQRLILDFSQLNIRYVKLKKNSGPGYARNIGWDNATSDYIAFLDADDSWHKDKLLLQNSIFKENPNIMLCGCGVGIKEKDKKINHVKKENIGRFITKNKLLIKNYFSTPAVMLKRSISIRFPNKKYSEDYLLWLLISNKYPEGLYFIHDTLVFLHKNYYGDSGLSANLWAMEKGEIENYIFLYKKNIISFISLSVCISFSLCKYILRVIKCKVKKS